jgi:hypothetical protein
VKAKEIK